MKHFEPYLCAVLEQTPRLLGQMDRNRMSPTHGCFDRQYWQYATSDFPCARYQEAALTLALLYTTDTAKNPYFRNPNMKEWVNAALAFWPRLQSRDGSLSEWYPNEHSFVATAFGVYAISEALLVMGKEAGDRRHLIDCLEKSARWLSGRHERLAQNQECGAAAAMYNMYLLTGNAKYRQNAEERVLLLSGMQDSEGWFGEYGGADIGYLSLALFYLGDMYKKSGMPKLKEIIQKASGFMAHFVHPDGTFGGTYGSRNTEYLFPYCFELVGSSATAVVAEHTRAATEKRSCVTLSSFDDRYLSYISYVYIMSYAESVRLAKPTIPPYKKNFTANFPHAGLLAFIRDGTYAVCNYRKGGAFYVFANGKTFIDSGVEVAAGCRLTSGYIGNFESSFDGSTLVVSGKLAYVKGRVMNPKRNILLRSFQLTFGRSELVGRVVKRKLRSSVITSTRLSDATFKRTIRFGKKIEVEDEVSGEICEAGSGGKSSYIYVPSSRYFTAVELGQRHAAKPSVRGSVRLSRTLW